MPSAARSPCARRFSICSARPGIIPRSPKSSPTRLRKSQTESLLNPAGRAANERHSCVEIVGMQRGEPERAAHDNANSSPATDVHPRCEHENQERQAHGGVATGKLMGYARHGATERENRERPPCEPPVAAFPDCSSRGADETRARRKNAKTDDSLDPPRNRRMPEETLQRR